MQRLRIEALTKEAFAPFGQVIETEQRDCFLINGGATERYHNLAQVELSDREDQAIVSIFRSTRLDYPLAITMLERHPKGSQAFIPLERQRFLVVVAPPTAEPDPDQIRAFITNGRQGINYAKSVWHHPILSLESDSDFLVIDRSGEGNNCDEVFLAPPQSRLLDLTELQPNNN